MALSERSTAAAALTNRVYMMISMILRHHRGTRYIHQGMPDLLYSAKNFNARSLEQFVLALDAPSNGILQLHSNDPADVNKMEQFLRELGYKVGTKLDVLLDPENVAGLNSLNYPVSVSSNEVDVRDFMGHREVVDPSADGYIRIRN